jgi:hypothetical protein
VTASPDDVKYSGRPESDGTRVGRPDNPGLQAVREKVARKVRHSAGLGSPGTRYSRSEGGGGGSPVKSLCRVSRSSLQGPPLYINSSCYFHSFLS